MNISNDSYDPSAYFENVSESERDAVFDSCISRKNHRLDSTRSGGSNKLLLVLCFVIAAVLFTAAGVSRFAQWKRESACTEMVIGTVTNAKTGHIYSGKSPDKRIKYQDVTYTFTYEGQEYTVSQRIYTKYEEAKELGKTYGFFVDPSDLENVRFPGHTEDSGMRTVAIAVGSVFLLIGVLFSLGSGTNKVRGGGNVSVRVDKSEDKYDPSAYFENVSKSERDAIFQSYISRKNTHPHDRGKVSMVLCLVLGGVLLTAVGVNRFSEWRRESVCTEMVIGTVTETAKGRTYSGIKPDSGAPYQDVRYVYTYGGTEYTTVERIFTKQEAGKAVGQTCGFYVDPADPENVRFPGHTENDGAGTVCFTAGMAALILGAVLFVIRRKNR